MKSLVDDKNLREREDLTQRLAVAETSLAEKNERIAVSQNTDSNYRSE